ncbi:putative transcription factor & chromatin remodeling ARID family [Helianthus debilis subsp. tardiflorus]
MVDWFLTKNLEVMTRPIPADTSDNLKVSLLELYMVLEREGGHRRVTENNLWAMVAKDMGFKYHDGEFMRLMYVMYLDVLVYYHKFKTTQTKVLEKEMVKSVMDPRRSRNEGDNKPETVADQDGADGEHYAFYVGNDWYGLNKLQKRKKFVG